LKSYEKAISGESKGVGRCQLEGAEMLLQRGGELERNQAQIIALRQPYAPLLVCRTMQTLA